MPTTPRTSKRRDRAIGPVVSLASVRKAHGLSAKALAAKITSEQGHTVSESTLHLIETGVRAGSDDLMRAWALALDLKPAALLYEADLRRKLEVAS